MVALAIFLLVHGRWLASMLGDTVNIPTINVKVRTNIVQLDMNLRRFLDILNLLKLSRKYLSSKSLCSALIVDILGLTNLSLVVSSPFGHPYMFL